MTELAAVLFDMDGTLVDTEVLWWDATVEIAARIGHRLTDADAPEVVGRAVEDTAAHLVRVTGTADADGVATALTAAFQERVDRGAPMRPGAGRLLAELAAEGVPFALVSASPRSVVDSVIEGALAHVPFAFTLSADDTVRTKPHPDPYRAAARRLGVPDAACVAVEDSPDGAASADAAGCTVLVVPSMLPVPARPGRIFAASLEEVTLAGLRRYVADGGDGSHGGDGEGGGGGGAGTPTAGGRETGS
ncbi:HAD family phosphatase [Streptomyces sp. NBC_00250]|uniref:HAD family hydrolase n=1 Tax=Streptomyces sp. NBC_00250 TaxID=2903641 RepID=UPI002E295709|nr:HAD family phosphatase [Streptomyces sp. NBC_00250]